MADHPGDALGIESPIRTERGDDQRPKLCVDLELVFDRRRRGRAERPDQRTHQRGPVLGKRSGTLEQEDESVARRVAGERTGLDPATGASQPAGEAGDEHLVLAGEVAVDRAERDTRLLGHGTHLHGLVPALARHAHGGLQDSDAALLLRLRASGLVGHWSTVDESTPAMRIEFGGPHANGTAPLRRRAQAAAGRLVRLRVPAVEVEVPNPAPIPLGRCASSRECRHRSPPRSAR